MDKAAIDTNVLLDFPEILTRIDKNIISYIVLYELDGLKKDPSKGAKARMAQRAIQEAQLSGRLIIDFNDYGCDVPDQIIICSAEENQCPLITSDKMMQIFATELNIDVVDAKRPERRPFLVKSDSIFEDSITVEDEIAECEYGYVEDTNGKRRLGYHSGGVITFINEPKIRIPGFAEVIPSNDSQKCFVDALKRDEIKAIFVTGCAGSGKTYITLAWAISRIKAGAFDRIVWVVPPVRVGGKDRDGYVPGSIEEKTAIYCGGLKDNITKLCQDAEEFADACLEIQSLSTIRGRTISNSVFVVDEAQNVTVHEMKTLLSRVEDSSKVIIIGDINQSDIREATGLKTAVERFYGNGFSAVINLEASQRGKIAEAADKL